MQFIKLFLAKKWLSLLFLLLGGITLPYLFKSDPALAFWLLYANYVIGHLCMDVLVFNKELEEEVFEISAYKKYCIEQAEAQESRRGKFMAAVRGDNNETETSKDS